jgi:ParB family transcriptional regulator, chromosome partitioning protein
MKGKIKQIDIDKVIDSPVKTRHFFDPIALEELSASIDEKGVINTIIVRPKGQWYEVIAGCRRQMATEMSNHSTIPALVLSEKTTDLEALEIAIIENVQREDLDPIDEAEGFLKWIRLYKKEQPEKKDISKKDLYGLMEVRLGKTKSYIEGSLKLLELPEEVKAQVGKDKDKIKPSTARKLTLLKDTDTQKEVAHKVRHDRLTTKQVQEYIDDIKAERTDEKSPEEMLASRRYFELKGMMQGILNFRRPKYDRQQWINALYRINPSYLMSLLTIIKQAKGYLTEIEERIEGKVKTSRDEHEKVRQEN